MVVSNNIWGSVKWSPNSSYVGFRSDMDAGANHWENFAATADGSQVTRLSGDVDQSAL